MSRLSALDASFLRVETPTAHMHVGWLAILELPEGTARLDAEGLSRSIASRLHHAPRFRQRLVTAPLGLGEPFWSDDPGFDAGNHIRVAPGPGCDEARLAKLTDEFLSRQLDRRRPLWQILVVPSLDGRRAAILGKVHHAMVDGIAAVELGLLLFDLDPEAPRAEPVAWEPDPADGPLRLTLDTVADAALEQFRIAGQALRLGTSPRGTARVAETMRRAALSLAEDALRPAPPSYLNVEIGPRRTLVTRRLELERLERVKRAQGVKLNDVVLAVVAGALRRLAAARGETPADLRVMVPVSTRDDSAPAGQGNRITFAFVGLPASLRDPLDRLQRIRAETLELKSSGRIAGSEMLMRSIGQLPGPLKDRAARLAASPRLYNLTVSNVPGPRQPLYAAGARVAAIYPVIPFSDGHSLSVGVLSYDGAVGFAAYADPVALPEVERLPAMFTASAQELERAAAAFAIAARSKVDSGDGERRDEGDGEHRDSGRHDDPGGHSHFGGQRLESAPGALRRP